MPYLFSKLKTDEKYRKAERESSLERDIVFSGWNLFVLFVKSQSEE